MDIFQSFPDKNELLERFKNRANQKIYKVNSHIHTPYSFSSFESIEQLFQMAVNEHIQILGINDFNVTDGYGDFYENAINHKVFPLFNIEFIGLINEFQSKNIRINDLNNLGRIYISGKGLKYPFSLDSNYNKILTEVIAGSQSHVRAMIDKVNECFIQSGVDIKLEYNYIKKSYAKELVRERHIAKAIRFEVLKKYPDEEKQKEAYTKIFDNKSPKSKLTDVPSLENEIRANLLKAGGKAYIEEDEKLFLDINILLKIITNAGGIPCYPVLLDDASGKLTEFETDYNNLYNELNKLNVACIELIPNRNDFECLKNFVQFFNEKGFVILFGTEHNTPDMFPLTPAARGNKQLDYELETISYEGGCVIAAHQYLIAKGEEGYIDKECRPKSSKKLEFIELGKAVVEWYLK